MTTDRVERPRAELDGLGAASFLVSNLVNRSLPDGVRELERICAGETQAVRPVDGRPHCVGVEVHELPVLRHTADGRLEAENVVTVEPGVCLLGTGGVRIEDLVVVHDDGAEVLTPFTKDLLTLD
jgi:Xaa-Pro aminopeptidase